MIDASFTFKGKTLVDTKRFESKFNRVVSGIGQQVATELQPIVEQRLGFEPPAPNYPLAWRSEKQRRAYFASKGFGRGIPTKRTGRIRKAWRVLYIPVKQGGGGTIQITNSEPAAQFVYGRVEAGNTYQQPFHIETGYPSARDTVREIYGEALVIYRRRFKESLGSFVALDSGSNV